VKRYLLIMAAGTWSDANVEREHLANRPVAIRVASLNTAEDIAKETATADGIIVTTHPLPRAFIAALGPSVRIIGRAGIGLDAIDLEAAKERGIAVFHCPDYCTNEVATHAVSMILALNRRLLATDAIARHEWKAWERLRPVAPIYEQTAGVIGCGRIGGAVIDRLRPLVKQILAYDPYQIEPPVDVSWVRSLDDLLSGSNIVTLHLPLTPETRAMIGARELALMKKGATIVNVSRGALIDECALADALTSGHISGAALDVLEEEPPRPDAPILRAPNVLLSPHVAWYSTAAEIRVRTMTVDGLVDYLEGRSPSVGHLAVVPTQVPSVPG
jgi:D-3-phosphoglycerate dehydrogenase